MSNILIFHIKISIRREFEKTIILKIPSLIGEDTCELILTMFEVSFQIFCLHFDFF